MFNGTLSYTLAGDANLDRSVDLTDFTFLARGSIGRSSSRRESARSCRPGCLARSRRDSRASSIRWTRMTESNSSSDMLKLIRSRSTPALFTRMSSRPYPSSAILRYQPAS